MNKERSNHLTAIIVMTAFNALMMVSTIFAGGQFYLRHKNLQMEMSANIEEFNETTDLIRKEIDKVIQIQDRVLRGLHSRR